MRSVLATRAYADMRRPIRSGDKHSPYVHGTAPVNPRGVQPPEYPVGAIERQCVRCRHEFVGLSEICRDCLDEQLHPKEPE